MQTVYSILLSLGGRGWVGKIGKEREMGEGKRDIRGRLKERRENESEKEREGR